MRIDGNNQGSPVSGKAEVHLLRQLHRTALVLVLASALNCVWAGVLSGKEQPAEVATRFVEAVAMRDYEEVVNCVYEPWMYAEVDSLCADRHGVSHQDREYCAENMGAPSLRDFVETPQDRHFSGWAKWKWPRLFPPTTSRYWCGTAEMEHNRHHAERESVHVQTREEVIQPTGEAFVVLNVRLFLSFRELDIAFTLEEDVSGSWRISGVERVLAPK